MWRGMKERKDRGGIKEERRTATRAWPLLKNSTSATG